jgi:ABC-type multidrug transport system ATPase subunit
MALPVFIYQIVLEKETRLIENMKINGLKMSNYWIVNYLFNLSFYCATAILFMIFGGKIFKLQVFSDTNVWLLIAILFGWGLAQVSLAFFVSVFLNKSQTATIVGYTIAVWFTTVASAFNLTIYSAPNQMDWFLMPIPSFTFSRLIYFVSQKCGYEHCMTGFGEMNREMTTCLIMLYVSAVVYMILALYLYQVVPQTYGVPKKWNYLCKNYRGNGRKKTGVARDTDEIGDLEAEREQNEQAVFDFDLSLEDADSKAERNMVYNLDKSDYFKYPLVVKDVRKVYPACGGVPPKVATKSMCLRIKKGEMFGLLGPNGAGKTTLISMLTGMYRPTSGNAWVAGYDIRNQLDIVQLQIGVCPQFDILWSDLTVEEHLLFFARLKGIDPEQEQARVETAIEEVLLQRFKHFPVKSLSGGMKRRLSVAISLVSEPKIIYLDEPSTGLDPENRRQLWDILSAQKGKRAIILTTHSMEEADVLCNRIGIVSEGILRCVAPQVRLKSIYGGGYHLFINCQKGKVL